VYWILRTLKRNVVMSMRHGDRAAANRALELLGKHLGLFVDQKAIEISYMDDADEYLARILEVVNAKTIEHAPALLPAANGGLNDGSED
jgi:hypothetical protein